MAFRTRVWGASKLVLLGVALLATYVLFAAASMRLALRSREVQVPDVINRTATDASGTTQTGARAPIAPDGSTGWDSTNVQVS